jgi:hypothetical protein
MIPVSGGNLGRAVFPGPLPPKNLAAGLDFF